MKFNPQNVEETAQIAIDFGSKLEPKNEGALVVGLYGELGAGKTTFMKYLALSLGVKETIQSPTFVIMKSFPLSNLNFQTLIHIDAYRIEKEDEMQNLDWQKIIADPKNIVFVEWPERIASAMPQHTQIFFDYGQEENERVIEIKNND